MSANTYRADIDGLRAISILAVVLFHAHVPGFDGGFVGVDIFFVISGYLITGILIAPRGGSIGRRLKEFYLRRCRRILPALLFLLAVTTALAMLLLSAKQLNTYGRYLGFTTVLLGNIAAWTDRSPGWPPLVHLWTIAVEEQFYLLYPLLLFGIGRSGSGRLVPLLGVFAAASFLLCLWASYFAPTANVFLAPTRGWELLLGGLIALGVAPVRGKVACELLSALSLVVILLCVHCYSSRTRYPGVYALLPCFSAGTLILCAREHSTWVSKALSLRPVVFIGLISYSLYLWHVPILVLFGYRSGSPPTALRTAVLLLASVLVAVASWRFVEQPFRRNIRRGSDARFIIAAALGNAALGVTGWMLWLRGMPAAVR
ncbi:MAG TPA: acyltransferase [Steroidobacteraceae bacterium]|nr:acyltransferase [Steroidobacteraceae bacterium]